ncbi:hypothetical protein Bca101_086632 [Brassica carinata]
MASRVIGLLKSTWPSLLHHPSAVAQILESQKWSSGGELMSLDMLLLDSKATIMQASVNVSRLATYGLYLRAGSMYSFTGFDVTQCNQNFRLSHSSLLIRFSDATTLAELTEPSSPIPKECFRFRNHSEMLGLANTNTQLPGKSEDSEVLETKGYLLIILFPTISPLPEMGSSSVLEKVKEVREKVEVKKETYSIGRRLLVMCLILALMEVFFQDHVLGSFCCHACCYWFLCETKFCRLSWSQTRFNFQWSSSRRFWTWPSRS